MEWCCPLSLPCQSGLLYRSKQLHSHRCLHMSLLFYTSYYMILRFLLCFNFKVGTFQLVLATDFLHTHAFYLYENVTNDNSTANTSSCQLYRAVMGYDARDLQNYYNLDLTPGELVNLHKVPGNTGRIGDWRFNFTLPPEQSTAEHRCRRWARRQTPIDITLLEVQSCPCTRQQLRHDRRFWLGYYSGLSSRPSCATVLLSGSQHTLECCYKESGALIVGPREGGTFKLYNPLFFYENYYQEDLLPYEDCCVNSRRCGLYYTHRLSSDCSDYRPLSPCKQQSP